MVAGFLGFITFEPEVVSAGNTIYVGSGVGNDSVTIQGGIILANPGDTVYVYSGVYFEIISINKPINMIGEDRDTTIIDGGGAGKVVEIYSDWVNVIGFTIRNCTVGIYITSSFIKIQGNEIYNNQNGVWTMHSSNNTYVNNMVHDNHGGNGHGFFFSGTPYSDNKIMGNVVYNNGGDGIHLEDQTLSDEEILSNNSIINNIVYNNSNDGIFIGGGSYDYIDQGGRNLIIDNIVHHNGLGSINPRAGIRIWRSCNNVIMGNMVYNNDNGIYLENAWYGFYNASHNFISGNKVYNNDERGIVLIAAANNTFIDNSIFDNNYNVYMERQSSGNTFINNTLTNATTHVYMKEQSTLNNFINCSLSKASYDDFNLTEDSHAILLNTTFNKARVYYGDTLSDLIVKWFMHVNVIYNNGGPVSGAKIWVNDTYGSNILNGTVDSQGWTRWIVVTEYIEQDLNGDHVGERIFYYTPHYVTATDGNLWGYADPIMDISKVVLINLGVPPPLLPPTNLTTKVVSSGNYIELEWDPPSSLALDHYLVYRSDSATEFDFSTPYNSSTTWMDPKNTTWVDFDPNVTQIDDDFYYIVRAANFDESDVSPTSNTAGVWSKTFQSGISTFSLPLEPFVKKDVEFYCQNMNATYIKWMNLTTHIWMQHDKGNFGNNTTIEVGEGYEIGFLGTSLQTRYTFTGLPGAMIIYDDDTGFLGFDPVTEAKNLSVSVEPNGDVTLIWQEPTSMSTGDWYEVYYSNTRDGFFGTFGVQYDLACPAVNFGNDTKTISGLGANNPGARLYFMIIPFNNLGIKGSSTYSIGIWTEEYLAGFDTFGIPLKLNTYQSADWYCDNIPDCVGINYYNITNQRWRWHSTRMPQGAFDPILEMTKGYQISTSGSTKFTFVGV